jgi:uncharacterized protein (UPF0179 family)
MGCTKQAQKGGVFKTHGAKVMCKRCSYKGCTSYSRGKLGLCMKHQSEECIITNENPSHEAITELPLSTPSRHSNYDVDDEELNSWIWRSSRMQRYVA